jgi:hypothetical protein
MKNIYFPFNQGGFPGLPVTPPVLVVVGVKNKLKDAEKFSG